VLRTALRGARFRRWRPRHRRPVVESRARLRHGGDATPCQRP
jgi:hypothetical protein